MDASECKHCGCIAVVVDFETEEAVCEKCGHVAENAVDLRHSSSMFGADCYDGVFVGNDGGELDGGNTKAYSETLDRLRGLTSVLQCGGQMLQEAEIILNETRKYKGRGKADEDIYCIAVLYITARRCSIPKTLYEMAKTFGKNYKELVRTYRRIVRRAGLSIPGHNFNMLLDRHVDSLIDHMESLKMFFTPKPRKRKISGSSESGAKLRKSPSSGPPSKHEMMETIHDIKEFAFFQEVHGRMKPMVFVAGVFAVALEGKFTTAKAFPAISWFCKSQGVGLGEAMAFKSTLKKAVSEAAKYIPGLDKLNSRQLASRVPEIVSTWKRLTSIEKKCVEVEENTPGETQTPIIEEGVGATPLVELLQEAGLVGDVSTRLMNRGYCPPKNYDVTFPKELARFVTPPKIRIEGLSSSSDSEGEITGRKRMKRGFVSGPQRWTEGFYKKYWEHPIVPGDGNKRSFMIEAMDKQDIPQNYHYFSKMKPRTVKGKHQGAIGLDQEGKQPSHKPDQGLSSHQDGCRDGLEGQNPAKKRTYVQIASEDEYAREGLSDIDDEEIDGYILNSKEVVNRELTRGGNAQQWEVSPDGSQIPVNHAPVSVPPENNLLLGEPG